MNLNGDIRVWDQIQAESDPNLLSCLMWDWIDELKVASLIDKIMLSVNQWSCSTGSKIKYK